MTSQGHTIRFQGKGDRYRAFTIIELLVSMAITAILMLAIGSAMLVATHAMPDANRPANQIIVASEVAEQLAAELQYAVTFTERTANTVEFIVADRNGDEAPEMIRYAWSGIARAPLTRQYNGGTTVTIAEEVEEFDLTYIMRTVTTTETQVSTTTSDEFMMASFEGWAGLSPDPMTCQVDVDCWAAEFFAISDLPPEADKLSIARVELQMRQSTLGAAGTFSVAIHDVGAAGNAEPATDPIGTPVVTSSSTVNPYPTYGWEEFTFSDVTINNPGTEYVIVVKGFDPDIAQRDGEVLKYNDKKAPADDTVGLQTSDAGTSWWPQSNKRNQNDYLFRVHGTYETTSEQPVEVTRYFLSLIDFKLRTGSDAATRIDAGVQVLNAPEVPAP